MLYVTICIVLIVDVNPPVAVPAVYTHCMQSSSPDACRTSSCPFPYLVLRQSFSRLLSTYQSSIVLVRLPR
ncbi:hypothetical protein F5B19DRAFT_436146 [Rostrohypoxylon terebratum]|nr:hypothetical protein F5B19DRAFT_436146 [Rostrohypoxylon terebratum]